MTQDELLDKVMPIITNPIITIEEKRRHIKLTMEEWGKKVIEDRFDTIHDTAYQKGYDAGYSDRNMDAAY